MGCLGEWTVRLVLDDVLGCEFEGNARREGIGEKVKRRRRGDGEGQGEEGNSANCGCGAMGFIVNFTTSMAKGKAKRLLRD